MRSTKMEAKTTATAATANRSAATDVGGHDIAKKPGRVVIRLHCCHTKKQEVSDQA